MPVANGCDRRKAHDRDVLKKAAETERNLYFDGKAQESIHHYVCTECGTKWSHLVESGVGGHGSFWEREE